MRVFHSSDSKVEVQSTKVLHALSSVSEKYLRSVVETISIPRNFWAESTNNKAVAEWIAEELNSFGYNTFYQGIYRNVVATQKEVTQDSVILIGAHYDSVPQTPGADDNASAVATMLGCAKAISEYAPQTNVCFVAFNCEEDGLIGSTDFVNNFLPESGLKIEQTHIIEMVGYCNESPNSQHMPSGLPIKVPDTGNFLGVLGNKDSKHLVDDVLKNAKTYLSGFPVVGLKLYFGIEKYFPDFARSDHFPFWKKGIPSLMWTDTAEFRNPNYHKKSDTPETLSYSFMHRTTQLLSAHILTNSSTNTDGRAN